MRDFGIAVLGKKDTWTVCDVKLESNALGVNGRTGRRVGGRSSLRQK